MTASGNFFEDFTLGQIFDHAGPRTISTSDIALYNKLYHSRFALNSSQEFAKKTGHETMPVDDFLVFNIVFGKTVSDISLNAIANLGYAEGRFMRPVYPGDTLMVHSQVIGLKQNSNAKSGIVYVRSHGENQAGKTVLEYVRWVMVPKRDQAAQAPETSIPELQSHISINDLSYAGVNLNASAYDFKQAGSDKRLGDYHSGEKIDHINGLAIEEAEHMRATRLYDNPAKVHFEPITKDENGAAKRLVYGGHIISLARALSFNGLANGCHILALNGGEHKKPCFAGDTIFAWSEVLDTAQLANIDGFGALRLRTIAAKGDKNSIDNIVLDLDYWVLMPH